MNRLLYRDLEIGKQYAVFRKDGSPFPCSPYTLTHLSASEQFGTMRLRDDCSHEPPFISTLAEHCSKVFYVTPEMEYQYELLDSIKTGQHIPFADLQKGEKYDWLHDDRGIVNPVICNPHTVVDRSEKEVVFADSRGFFHVQKDEEDYFYRKHLPAIFTKQSIGKLCVDEHGMKYKVAGYYSDNGGEYYLLDKNIGTTRGGAILLAVDGQGRLRGGEVGFFKFINNEEEK